MVLVLGKKSVLGLVRVEALLLARRWERHFIERLKKVVTIAYQGIAASGGGRGSHYVTLAWRVGVAGVGWCSAWRVWKPCC